MMCIAIPSRVVAVRESTAIVERFGERIVVSTLMLPEPAEVGDYVIIQARAYAVEKIAPAEAQESLALFREWLGADGDERGEGGDPRERI